MNDLKPIWSNQSKVMHDFQFCYNTMSILWRHNSNYIKRHTKERTKNERAVKAILHYFNCSYTVIPLYSSFESNMSWSIVSKAFLRSRKTTALIHPRTIFNDQLTVASSCAVTVE